jgi:hypothetical protein
MLNFRILLPAAALLFASCGNETPSSRNTAKVDTAADTVAMVDSVTNDSIPVSALATQMRGDTIAPADRSQVFYSFTAALLKKKGKVLSAKEVRRRFLPLDAGCDEEAAYRIQRYFALDSLKKLGQTPDSDMGAMVWGEVSLLDTIRKDASGCWVTWRVDYETTQACPYASGTYFMLSTYDASGKLVATQCMAREEGGADAPISWSHHEVCNIFKDGSYRSLVSDTTEDYDVNDKPVYSVMRKTFTGQISAAGKITRTEEEIERTE